MDLYEQRVRRLREHVLSHSSQKAPYKRENTQIKPPYEVWTNRELKEELDRRGVKYNSRATKPELLELIDNG